MKEQNNFNIELINACRKKNLNEFISLLNLGANISVNNDYIFRYSCETGNYELLNFILSDETIKNKINLFVNKGICYTILAAKTTPHFKKVFSLLLNYYDDKNKYHREIKTEINRVFGLSDYNLDINELNQLGKLNLIDYSKLTYATIENKKINILNWLIDNNIIDKIIQENDSMFYQKIILTSDKDIINKLIETNKINTDLISATINKYYKIIFKEKQNDYYYQFLIVECGIKISKKTKKYIEETKINDFILKIMQIKNNYDIVTSKLTKEKSNVNDTKYLKI